MQRINLNTFDSRSAPFLPIRFPAIEYRFMSYGKFTLVLCRAGQCLNSYATIKQRSTLLTIFISPQSALSVARTRLMRRLINTLLSKSTRDNKYWRKPWYRAAINSETTDLKYTDFSLSFSCSLSLSGFRCKSTFYYVNYKNNYFPSEIWYFKRSCNTWCLQLICLERFICICVIIFCLILNLEY